MAKAITEVAIGAAAIGAAFLIPGGGIAIGSLIMSHAEIAGALISLGASEVMAGIGDALKGNQGGLAVGVTTPIGPWGYIYGTQKLGGVEIFRQSNSSQGTSNDKQLHRVYALAAHPCVADGATFQLRIDGKQVLLQPATYGYGWSSYSPTQIMKNITSISRDAFGLVTVVLAAGIAGLDGQSISITECPDNTLNGTWIVTQPNPSDDTTFTFVSGGATSTQTSGNFWTLYPDYKDKIYVEFLNGNHTATFQGLIASGTSWSATDLCLGRTLVYVRMGWDSGVFPSSIPNVSFVIQGKNDILDPRTSTRGFTNNAALCIADYLSMSPTVGGFGLAIGTDIPSAQLIAAANTCDESIALAGGGSIPRYECDTFFLLNQGRGSILKSMLTSCAGRLSYQGGQYSIFPGVTVSPTLQLTDADIIGTFKWKPRLSIRETCNAVKGTYISPENAYQQADFPAYMQDADHGFVTDTFLAEDQGERIFAEVNFPCTVRSATAQRLAKIALMRTRFQIRGTMRCSMRAYQVVALDVIQVTHPRYTWVNMTFEVLSSRFVWEKVGDVPIIAVELDVAQTDSTIYDWSIDEQLTPQGYAQPSNVGNSVCSPPEDVTAYSGPGATISGIVYPSTISSTSSGVSSNSIYVRWLQPNDANVVYGGHLELQWQPLGASIWNALPNISPLAESIFINGVTDGAQYMVQVRAVNCAGVPSAWVIVGPVTVGTAVSSIGGLGSPLAPGALIGIALSGGGANILVEPFAAAVGTASASCLPAGEYTITGKSQDQLYYVYYVDPAFAGGAITPIATQNPADFLGKAGYYYIGPVVTPVYSGGGGGATVYRPTSWTDQGTQSTQSPSAVFSPGGTATVGARNVSGGGGGPVYADIVYGGFGSGLTSGSKTLTVSAALLVSGGGSLGASTITATIGGSSTTMFSASTATALANYTLTVPSGKDLSTITVECTAGPPSSGGSTIVRLNISDIDIQ